MNYITFHNRKKILEDYVYGPNNYRCIICSYTYHPQYTKSQNTFLQYDCDHLIHRHCLKSRNGHLSQNWQKNCELCRRDEAFDESARQVCARRTERMDQYIQYEYEYVIKAVEKNGRYMYK